MWNIQHKTNNDSQPWLTLESYDNEESALSQASRLSSEYFMIIVIAPDGSVIWSN